MGRVLSPPLKGDAMQSAWKPSLKPYPHFDAVISTEELDTLVRDPQAVAAHAFFPLLLHTQSWQPFRSQKGGKPAKKERPIRYACRRDANIFSYYRHILAAPYEELLMANGLDGAVIAYRSIRSAGGAGKSNVEFANDAFARIDELGNCAAVALDIKGFFESLDHAQLEKQWLRLLGGTVLPPDHAAVFRAITQYAQVDRDAAYERLGYLRSEIVKGKERLIFAVPFDEMPKQLCSVDVFREKIAGQKGRFKSLIDKNRKPCGIPQGAPLSDLLANFYMFDFDVAMKAYCVERGGIYYRYSDDIIAIIPGAEADALAVRDFAIAEVAKHGKKLRIKDSKTSAVVYERIGAGSRFRTVGAYHGKNGLEYLGFRYDGQRVFVRDATISRLYRKIAFSIKAECAALIKRHPGSNVPTLTGRFDYSKFFQRYGRVDDFDPSGEYNTWTFWTYARRAMKVFKGRGVPIRRQLRNYKTVVRRRVEREILQQLAKA
jgi:hypothetical protein